MQLFRLLAPFVSRYRTRLVLGSLCAAGDAAVTASVPQLIRRAVDALVHGASPQLTMRYGGLLVLLAVGVGLLRGGQHLLVGRAAFLIEADMRAALFDRLLVLEQRFFARNRVGDLLARVTNDLSAVQLLLWPGGNSLIYIALLVAVAAGLMFATHAMLTLLVLLLLPVVALLFVVVGSRLERASVELKDQFGALSARAQESFSGIRTIKAYAQEAAELRAFSEANERYRASNQRYALLSGLLWPAIAMLLGLINALVLLVGGRLVAAGSLTIGELALFNSYLLLLAWPMIALGWTANAYHQAAASARRIAALLDRRPEIASPEHGARRAAAGATIEFRDVGVRVEHGAASDNHQATAHGEPGAVNDPEQPAWMLRHISFSVPPGTSLAIMGATGSGKSVLLSLLARLRDPDEGAVLLDGQDLRSLALDELRRSLGFVPQDTFLFSMTLRENLLLGQPAATEADIERAVHIARLSSDLPRLPDGLDTLIGERGATLSGGQKQRAAIARALLRDVPILVLDDALSSVDAHTGEQILAGLRDLRRDQTTIVVAQRVASVKDADQILVLHDGRIAEQGTHQTLLALDGRYAAMYRQEQPRINE